MCERGTGALVERPAAAIATLDLLISGALFVSRQKSAEATGIRLLFGAAWHQVNLDAQRRLVLLFFGTQHMIFSSTQNVAERIANFNSAFDVFIEAMLSKGSYEFDLQ